MTARTDGGEEPGDAGFDEWLEAIDAGEGYYLESPTGEGSLPPRRICPHSRSTDLEERPLPETGEIEAVTVVHVASPQFADDTPYATAVADFGPVRLTGVVRGVDLEEVETGTTVEPTVEERETTGGPLLVFRPA
ncbi:MAG: OB-fold domain-containing protein [Haloferacaceae archaeon]